jgi:CheY-like chemotaxis protein
LTAANGPLGLQRLEENRDVVVILSDMRMPQMDGATFLEKSRAITPDASRILLTGYADLDSAVAAVNLGQVFRFMQKPSSPASILAAVDAGVNQHRLVTAEKVLLEQTLHGAIAVLTQILGLVSPAEFGHGTRLKRLVADIATRLAVPNRWQAEVAAMLVPLANLTSAARVGQDPPIEVVDLSVARTGASTDPSASRAAASFDLVAELLAPIPRLDEVRYILQSVKHIPANLTGLPGKTDAERAALVLATSVVAAAMDFDALESDGLASGEAVGIIAGREGRYLPQVVEVLTELVGKDRGREVRELALSQLKPAMVFAEDVRTQGGMLLIARGHEVTQVIIDRLLNYPPRTVREPMRVFL